MKREYTAAHWGIYEIDRQAPGGPDVRPLEQDPNPSPIGQGMVRASLDPALRVLRPAIREGWLEGRRPARRGAEPFVQVGWDQALELTAGELRRVIAAHGNQAIFGGSYGWSSAGRFHHAQSQIHRFLNALGGYVAHKDSYSLGAGRVIMPYIVASMDALMAQHSSWDTLVEHTQLLLCFGGASEKNAQVSPGGPGQHHLRSSLQAMARRGVEMINISPTRDDLDPQGAFEWLPIRPGTDTALILALMHTLVEWGLHDRAFLARYTVGFERLEPYLMGHEDGQAKSARWAAPITGIPAERIRALALRLAQRRSLINMAWSLQRADYGEQPFWGLVTLACLLGQIGRPGGGFGVGYGPANTMGNKTRLFSGPTLDQGRNGVTSFIPVARIADMLLNPGGRFRYNGAWHAYPDIRLVYWAGGNPFHHHQDLNRLVQAWQKPDTIIVHEQYWTPSAKMADIVLPANTTFERDDLAYSKRERFMVYMSAMASSVGQSRSDYDIFADLAGRLGVQAEFTRGLDSAGWLRRLYEDSRQRAAAQGVSLCDYEQFREQGLIDLDQLAEPAPVTMLADFIRDPQAHPLQTPSGRIEIYSERIAAMELPDCGGHVRWYPAREGLGMQEAPDAFHLITDQPQTRLHSQLDHSHYSRQDKIQGRAPVCVHPDDARRLGLADGQLVRLYNERGACLAAVRLSEALMPGVLRLSTGAWFDPGRDARGRPLELHGNPNVLTRDAGASELSQGCSAQSCLVRIEPYAGDPPALSAFEPPPLR